MFEERIPKQGLRAKQPWEAGFSGELPPFPTIIFKDTAWAKCPGCGRIIELRTCQGCKAIMCYECLSEHQIVCLRKLGE
jgi:hypothetical protein